MTAIAHYDAIARHISRSKEPFHTFVQGRHDLFGRSEALDGKSGLHIARCTSTKYWRAELEMADKVEVADVLPQWTTPKDGRYTLSIASADAATPVYGP
ncbi:hypothetical protein PTTW11_01357 [Pyrenophora teres f. teres]|uniref:Uncharacterized protein n=1 Tax=Pyrenophora teres f. teres TaxID=97479 RepID=A0A6S6VEL4_9PLEO|nr:hypothetical protein PTTW11_01357 [Pyrenophora teres f. teres]